MTRESAYFKEIERLLTNGFEPKHIVKITNIPKATVYRIRDKLRKESRIDFNELMEKDYLWKYQQNLENFSRTIQEMNEEMEVVKKKYDAIEYQIMESIEQLQLPRQSMTKASLLVALISCQSSRTNELIKLAQQRDKSTDLKAKVYNAGPVVHAIDQWVQSTNPSMGNLPKNSFEEPKALEESPPKLNISVTEEVPLDQDDLDVLKEMEDE